MASPEKIVRAFKVVEVREPSGLLSALTIDRFYVPFNWNSGGPFFLYAFLDEAVEAAEEHCRIFRVTTRVYEAECLPIEPQPKLFPPAPGWSPEFLLKVIEPWRELIRAGDIEGADEFLRRVNAYWHRPPNWVIAHGFALLDPPVVEVRYEGKQARVFQFNREVIAHAG